jgi:hypothetical protein
MPGIWIPSINLTSEADTNYIPTINEIGAHHPEIRMSADLQRADLKTNN